MYNSKRYLFLISLLFIIGITYGQKKNPRYVSYIETYKDLAIEQMRKYKIPASITLAQGLLESGAGTGTLARKSNNHFGIKCGSNWHGRTVRHDDDARRECFRAYSHPRDSYRDHSLFLTRGARYNSLFSLKITDYRGWARGLKKAGYATDPNYALRLIKIIEDYDLYKYDTQGLYGRSARHWNRMVKKKPWLINPHQVFLANDLAYVVVREGDSFKLLEGEFKISDKKLARYNDLPCDYSLHEGDVIYLREKRKKALKKYKVHVVTCGESMYSISQKYGIRMKYLYRMNKKSGDYLPKVGDILRLR